MYVICHIIVTEGYFSSHDNAAIWFFGWLPAVTVPGAVTSIGGRRRAEYAVACVGRQCRPQRVVVTGMNESDTNE